MKRFNFIQINDNDSVQVVQQSKSKIQLVDFNITEIHNIPEEVLSTGTPGIYILIGSEDSQPYIGESTNVIRRITNGHMKNEEKMDWIERVITITSTDTSNPFNKTQIQWIERELITLFEQSGIKTDNKTAGFKHDLSYMDVLELQDDIYDIKSALGLLKIDLNTFNESSVVDLPENNNSVSVYYKNKDIDAEGIYINGSIVVNEGSTANISKHDKSHAYSQNIIAKLLKNEVIEIKDETLKFLKSYEFKNTSPAAVVFRGKPTNGWNAWKIKKTGENLQSIRKVLLKDIPDVPYETIVLKISDNPDINYHLGHWRISQARVAAAEVLAFAPVVNGKRTITKAFKIKGYKILPEHNNRIAFEIFEEDPELMKTYQDIDVSYDKGANPCFTIAKKTDD